MARRSRDLEYRLAAAGAAFGPQLLLEQQVLRSDRGPAMTVGFRDVDGVRVRCAESDGPVERTVLLTSPWPESVYAFAPIWSTLAGRFRLFAVDLPGFGASQARPEHRSPSGMGTFLVRLIDECGLGRPHLVAPDVGASAALFATLLSPASVASLVVGSGGVAVPIQLGPPLCDWVLAPDVDRFRGLDPRTVVDIALSTVTGHEFPRAVREDYHACYAGDRFVESMEYVRRYPEALPTLAARLNEIETPVMVFAGSNDRVVPLANAEFLTARLRRSRLATFAAGHFVWEEQPTLFAQLLGDWIDEHNTTDGGS
jgi:pimeloyl-ACP methyl ester carboxylesterase